MIFFTTAFRSAVTTSVVAAAVAIAPVLTTVGQTTVTLNGAGATFPDPLYQRYAAEFKRTHPNMTINYQGIGSGGGIKQMIAGAVDFAGSDVAMTDSEASQVTRGVVFVPTAGGPVAVVYNLSGVSNLKLSRAVLPAIFAGQITNWNDPKIAAANPGVNLPNQPIRLAVRADSSGTSYIFTNHLSAIDPYFKGRVSASKTPSWPGRPLKGKGNPGVAQIVKRTPGTIGYVEATYATSSNLQVAQVENKKGRYVSPTLEETQTALESVQFKDDFRVDFNKLGDPADGYPIAGLTWLMVYKQYPDAAKAEAVKTMVNWILNQGQAFNPQLGYVKIPNRIANEVGQAVNSGVTTATTSSK